MTDSIIEYVGELKLGNVTIPCYVTSIGERLIAGRKMQEVLKVVEESGDRGQRPGTRFRRFLSRKFIKGLISNEDMEDLFTPIQRTYKGRSINGYKAEALTRFCELMMEARDQARLTTERQHIVAEQSAIIYKAFAKVGIIALVDEATGYQAIRSKDELRKILEAYISKELLPWTERFPEEFYREMFRLRGWPFNSIEYNQKGPQGPRFAGKLTRELVYRQLPPGIVGELERLNPNTQKGGRRKYHHHRFLSGDIGNPHLEKHVAVVTALMRVSPNWRAFQRNFSRNFGRQRELDLGDDPADA